MMLSTDEVIEAIYAASSSPAGWDDAVRRIGDLFETATGALYVDPDVQDGLEASVVATFGHSQAAITSYQTHFGAVNPFDRARRRFPLGDVVTDVDLDYRLRLVGAFENSEYYNDWVRPQHVRHVMGCYVDRSASGRLVAAFWRPSDVGAYDPDELTVFERLMRHATRSFEIGARLQAAEGYMMTALDRSVSAVFTLGRDGRIRHCNAVGDALLRAGCALLVRDGHLRAAVPQQQAALDRLIACVFDPRRVAWAENARILVRRTDAGPPLEARVAAVSRHFGPFAPDGAASVVLTVTGFEMETALSAERLRLRFGMSAAQARLALLLRAGLTLKEAAGELGVGYETVRTHLKTIFERTGTHRQAELVLLLRDLDAL